MFVEKTIYPLYAPVKTMGTNRGKNSLLSNLGIIIIP